VSTLFRVLNRALTDNCADNLTDATVSLTCLVGELRSGNFDNIFGVLILPVTISNYELILSRTHLPLWFAVGLS